MVVAAEALAPVPVAECIREAGCMWAAAVQEPGSCDPAPAKTAMIDIPNPRWRVFLQAAAVPAQEEADPEELSSYIL